MPLELNWNKIAVIDGDSDTIDVLDYALRDHGFQPAIRRRGTRIKQWIEQEKPGGIILEIALPDRDGRQVIKEIKDDWDMKKIPVVVLSSYLNRLDRKSFDMVEGVFSKPTSPIEVLAVLRHHMAVAQGKIKSLS